MGVDLYIENIRNELGEKWRFRDSYNSSNLFSQLGLSWMGVIDQCTTAEGRIYVMSPANASRLLAVVESLTIPPADEIELGGSMSPEARHSYFIEKKAQFAAFLKKAIDMDESIICDC